MVLESMAGAKSDISRIPLQWICPKLPGVFNEENRSRSRGRNSSHTHGITNGTSDLTEMSQSLPSFSEIRRKTLETLYGHDRSLFTPKIIDDSDVIETSAAASSSSASPIPFADKSPKGSVDVHIQHLVDLINHHTVITTLSSCSGRISLFNPNGSASPIVHDEIQPSSSPSPSSAATTYTTTTTTTTTTNTSTKFTDASGKGRGAWLVVSHDILNPEEMIAAIFNRKPNININNNNAKNDAHLSSSSTSSSSTSSPVIMEPWTLKFEPMLLHIAASSLTVGQALLQVALACGFRESGLVVSSKRVTVAIRSHSLSLSLPLFPDDEGNGSSSSSSALCPSKEYIRAVVEDCNKRLIQNWKHMQRLYRAIEKDWFELCLRPHIQSISTLPALRLWDVATVCVPASVGSNQQDEHIVYAFGGYGRGPNNESLSSRRSDEIFQLTINGGGKEGQRRWERVSIPKLSSFSTSSSPWKSIGATVTPMSRLPRPLQGIAAARLQQWVVLWGGRESPKKLSDDLLLFDTTSHQLGLVEPIGSIRPSARWGHSLIPISKNRFILIGGGTYSHDVHTELSDTPNLLEDIYILHYVENRGFQWELIESKRLLDGRMHAATSIVEQEGYEMLILVGGLSAKSTQLNPLLAFSSTPKVVASIPSTWSCRIGKSKRFHDASENFYHFQTLLDDIEIKEVTNPENRSTIGGEMSSLGDGRIILLSGGAHALHSTSIEAYFLQVEKNGGSTLEMTPLSLIVDNAHFDLANLVHHNMLTISDEDVLLLGGGNTSFAFGDSFATSYHLRINLFPSRHTIISSSPSTSSSHVTYRKEALWDQTKPHSTFDPNKTSKVQNANISTPVIYVAPQDAKRIKTQLMKMGWLDKRVRMIPVMRTNSLKELGSDECGNDSIPMKQIAIPILLSPQEIMSNIKTDVDSIAYEGILGTGHEENMPPSTSRFAAVPSKKK